MTTLEKLLQEFSDNGYSREIIPEIVIELRSLIAGGDVIEYETIISRTALLALNATDFLLDFDLTENESLQLISLQSKHFAGNAAIAGGPIEIKNSAGELITTISENFDKVMASTSDDVASFTATETEYKIKVATDVNSKVGDSVTITSADVVVTGFDVVSVVSGENLMRFIKTNVPDWEKIVIGSSLTVTGAAENDGSYLVTEISGDEVVLLVGTAPNFPTQGEYTTGVASFTAVNTGTYTVLESCYCDAVTTITVVEQVTTMSGAGYEISYPGYVPEVDTYISQHSISNLSTPTRGESLTLSATAAITGGSDETQIQLKFKYLKYTW
jgi:hypothetical protein